MPAAFSDDAVRVAEYADAPLDLASARHGDGYFYQSQGHRRRA